MNRENPYKKISVIDINYFRELLGESNVHIDASELEKYSHDETEDLIFIPEIVLRPKDAKEISNILKYCSAQHIPVTPRAGGTGLTGGALAIYGGVILSIEKLNRIVDIDRANLQVTTEPGVITEVLQNAVQELGLFYPPDPSSRGTCFIGGNIAENSGGPRAVKYGVVKDYVLNLEVVLPTGEIIWTGANTIKNATGYNLTQLIVGSEGTLAIVTKIVLRLIPLPKLNLLILIPFNKIEEASEAVSFIFQNGYTPSALELVEKDALKIAAEYVENTTIHIDEKTEALLYVEMDGNHADVLMQEIEGISMLLEKYDIGEIYFAESSHDQNELWKIRRKAAEAVKIKGYTIEEDTVVPRAQLPALIKGVKELGRINNFQSVSYGHAGDGNLHIRIKHPQSKHSYQNIEIENVLKQLFQLVKSLGGTISAEHGIGLIQQKYLPIVFQEIHLALFQKIKDAFDPHHILNPGKAIGVLIDKELHS